MVPENLPVKTLVHKDLTIEGLVSGRQCETYWRIPELKLGFDLGAQPWSFMGTNAPGSSSHMHLDHMAALPVYIARRRMMKMEPPTIYLPEDAIENVQKLFEDRPATRSRPAPLPVDCREAGDEIELSREHVVTGLAPLKHTVPSVGYVVWERRRKAAG